MDKFMTSCVQLYLDLAPGLELDRVPIPFLDGDGRDAPSRSAAHKGPLEECPWRAHTFPLNPWPDLRAYEQHKKSQQSTASGVVLGSAAGGDDAASGVAPSPPAVAEDRGRLAPVAARILMKTLYSARNAQPDVLKAVTHLACFFTKWTYLCDRRLHRLVCHIHSACNYRLLGWIGTSRMHGNHICSRMLILPGAWQRNAALRACISRSAGRTATFPFHG